MDLAVAMVTVTTAKATTLAAAQCVAGLAQAATTQEIMNNLRITDTGLTF